MAALIEARLAPIDEVAALNEANELVAIFTTSVKRLRLTHAVVCCLVARTAFRTSTSNF